MSISLKRGAFIRYLRRLPPKKPFIPKICTVCPIELWTRYEGEEFDVNRTKMMSLHTRKSQPTPRWISDFVTAVDNMSSRGEKAWNELTPRQCLILLKRLS